MSSFSPGPTASCTVFLPGLVNYPGRLLPSATRNVGSAALQMAYWLLMECQSCDWVGDWLICGSWILDIFSASKSRGVDLYADCLTRGNIQYVLIDLWPRKPLQLCPLMGRIFVPSFIESSTKWRETVSHGSCVNKMISSHEWTIHGQCTAGHSDNLKSKSLLPHTVLGGG